MVSVPGAKRRPTPSPVMMKLPLPSDGGEVVGKSGMSPTQAVPFQRMPGRVGSQGWPLASAEARLYMTRRLSGHDQAQSWK